MKEDPKLIIPSWDEVYKLLLELARRAQGRNHPDAIVGIARGGLVPARVIADLLSVQKLGTIGVAFYTDIGRTDKRPRVTQPLSIDVESQRILVVDDVADTGSSLALVVAELHKSARDLRTAAIYKKPWTKFIPDFYAKETDAWVVFPWERRETVENIRLRFLDAGRSLVDLQALLVRSGMNRHLAENLIAGIGEAHHK